MNLDVEKFVEKSKQWREEIVKLRRLLLRTTLEEDFKWRLPCYTHMGNNVVIIQPFKACLGLMFFKGSLLKDPKKLLVDNGPNSQAAKRLEFRSVEEIADRAATIRSYISEAMKIEDSGQKVDFKRTPQELPAELKKMFSEKPKFKRAFEALTPGRQRAYLLHFSGAKQSATRQSRIKKYISHILEGKGISDR